MPIHNADIAAIFGEIADRLEIQGANPFRIRAYRNAARILAELPQEARVLLERGEDLTRLPGIGEDLAAKIREIVESGHCSLLDRLRRELPPAVTELLRIPGLGPKRVKTLYHDLNVQTVEQLYRAARDGRIRALPGFGEKTELNILQAVEARLSKTRRFKLAVAAQYAETLTGFLKVVPGMKKVTVAGSCRRMRETVNDLDILVAASAESPVLPRFTAYDEVAEGLSAGTTRASVVLKSGLQVDVRVVAQASYGAALCHFTGSRAHNSDASPRSSAAKSTSTGCFATASASPAQTSRPFTKAWVCRSSRQNCAKTGARSRPRARAGCRNWWSSPISGATCTPIPRPPTGTTACATWRWRPRRLGFEYLAISEHSRHLTVAHGLDPQRLARQGEEIDR